MEDLTKISGEVFEAYIGSFSGLTTEQRNNFTIKRDHSFRVSDNARQIAGYLKLDDEDVKLTVMAGIFHDIGRFKQLIEFNTWNDGESFDHAEIAIVFLKELDLFRSLSEENREIVFTAISNHNKIELPHKLPRRQFIHACLLRDADKLDIYKVLTDYYADKSQKPNHALTWDMPAARQISPGVAKEVLAGNLVSKNLVKNEIDVKIMQFSWVFDINFKPSFEIVFKNRFLEKIYDTLPKNDIIIEIYRKIKVYAENRLMEQCRSEK